MKTLGHLSDNGGLRAHSIGPVYPYRIMAQGVPGVSLKWWVISPQGEKLQGYFSPGAALYKASLLKASTL